MVTPPEQVGLGRYAELPAAVPLEKFAGACKQALGLAAAAIVGEPRRAVKTLAIVAGSAGAVAAGSGEEVV